MAIHHHRLQLAREIRGQACIGCLDLALHRDWLQGLELNGLVPDRSPIDSGHLHLVIWDRHLQGRIAYQDKVQFVDATQRTFRLHHGLTQRAIFPVRLGGEQVLIETLIQGCIATRFYRTGSGKQGDTATCRVQEDRLTGRGSHRIKTGEVTSGRYPNRQAGVGGLLNIVLRPDMLIRPRGSVAMTGIVDQQLSAFQ